MRTARQVLAAALLELATVVTIVTATATGAAGADAVLSPGNPLSGITHQEFSGVGGNNTSVVGANNALTAFEAAIGGVKNVAASPQNGGFRLITWDGVAIDGTDFGGNTTVIVANKAVAIPLNRFQTQGAFFDEVYAVAADGFKAVNSSVAAANPAFFPSFSPVKTFAMFNDNGIDMHFVFASGANTAPHPASTRGFGAIFENVRLANTTSIEFFHDTFSLGKFFVPVGTQGQNEFLGELFSAPVVTSVSITCGTDVLFTFDGTTVGSGAADNPAGGHNLVVTDDFAYAEPVAATPAGQTPIAASAGVFFNGSVGVFSDGDPAASFHDFSGHIDWGDGFTSPATFVSNSAGGFDVRGSHTYRAGGTYALAIDVQDFGGSAVTFGNIAVVGGTPEAIIVSGSDKGGEPRVRVFGNPDGERLFDFLAFEQKFKGGVRVATGDVNGDGVPDIVVARGPGGTPEVRVFDGKSGAPFATPLGSFLAYDGKFKGGVSVAVGDVNGDGKADIVTAPGAGGAVKSDLGVPPLKGVAPQVKVFDGATGALILSFFGEDPKLKKGLTVAVADVDGDGTADIITGAGSGGPPFVNFFNGGTGLPLFLPGASTNSFLAFDPKFKGGVFVAAGDLNGDGKADVIVGGGHGGGPHVKVFDGATFAQTADFLGFGITFKGGVRVAVGDLDGDGKADIITGTGNSGGALVNGFDGRSFRGIRFLFASDTGRPGGIFVAGSE